MKRRRGKIRSRGEGTGEGEEGESMNGRWGKKKWRRSKR